MFGWMGKGIAATLILCGCLTAGTAGVWLDVPFIRQKKEGCGSASVAMVMQYWLGQQALPTGESAQEPAIFQALYSPESHGILASDMEGYLQKQGFDTFAFRGTWQLLRQHLEKGRPLLVALKPSAGAPLHYVVVAGMDSESGLVMMNDPSGRKLLKQERKGFEKQWESAGNWTLLAVPRSDIP